MKKIRIAALQATVDALATAQRTPAMTANITEARDLTARAAEQYEVASQHAHMKWFFADIVRRRCNVPVIDNHFLPRAALVSAT